MKIKPIKSEAAYDEALTAIDVLLTSSLSFLLFNI